MSSVVKNHPDSTSNNNAISNSTATLLKEADKLAKSKNWTRGLALYVIYCRAMADGDKIRREGCYPK